MVTRSTVRDKSFTNYGSRIDPYYNVVPFSSGPPTVYGSVFTAWEEVNSVSSPAFTVKKLVRVPYVPRKDKKVVPPIFPTLRLPLMPTRPTRRPKQSKRSFDRILGKFEVKYQNYQELVKRKQHQYQLNVAKYTRRLAVYDAYQRKILNGTWKREKVKVISKKDRQYNPYSYYISYDSGLKGTSTALITQYVYYPYRRPLDIVDVIDGDVDGFIGNANLSTQDLSDLVSKATAAADSIAISRLYNKIGEQAVHVGNIIAERKQTYDLLSTYIKRLVSYVVSFSWKRLGTAFVNLLNVRQNKQLANETLAFLFGAKPLISDIYSVVQRFQNQRDGDGVHIKAVGKKSDNASFVDTRNPSPDGSSSFSIGTIDNVTLTVDVKVRYTLEYLYNSGSSSYLQEFGLINPAEVIWEKLPWSFVIDWVLPIGNWIHSFTAEVGLTFLRGTKVTTITKTYLISSTRTNVTDEYDFKKRETWKANRTFVVKSKVREILTKAPKAQFPTWKNPASIYHIIEALALLRQQRR